MDFAWAVKYATEFLGTAILIILGNGAVAKVAGSLSLLVTVWGL